MASIHPDLPRFGGREGAGGGDRLAESPAGSRVPGSPGGEPAGAAAEREAFEALSLSVDFRLELSLEARVAAATAGGALPPPGGAATEDLFAQVERDPEMLKLMALLKGISGEAYDDFMARFRRFADGMAGRAGAADLAALGARVREGLEGLARRVERARSVSAESSVEVRVRFEFFLEDRRLRARVEAMADPLVLDLDGDGFELTSLEREGVRFDIDGNGTVDRTALVAPDDALLALDRNGNGRIDDGGELFGDQHGAADGFAELSRFDANGDGRIDRADPVFYRLLAWRDLDSDGRSGAGELTPLADLGIASLSLASERRDERVNGNVVARAGAYTRGNGATGGLGEAWFRYSALV